MGYFICLLIGLAIGLAIRAGITRNLRRRLASSEALRRAQFDQNQQISAELFEARKTNGKIRAFAARLHVERIQRLGGTALLPATADRSGQQPMANSGSRCGGSHF